jgi:phage terminase large subunit-like protein
VYHSKEIHAIHFNTGVSVYFKSYKQSPADLQTGTCDAIFCDEELPEELYDELMLRLSASNGYFHMVFTATLGQEFWRQVMEPEDFEIERLKGALKKCVSMYECMTYEDGTPSHWTTEKIQMVVDRCKDQKAVLRRVFGRFVRDDGEGLKYEKFQMKRHLVKAEPISPEWFIYGGVDIGSGAKGNHPAAIVFLAVRPDYQAARMFLAWRGDGVITTAGDVMNQFIEMTVENKLTVTGQYYDWASIDFTILVERLGQPFIKADKSHIKGEEIMNILFKNDMLLIHDTPEGQKLAAELSHIRKSQAKNKLKDDLSDALRYIVTSVPWDFEAITAYTEKTLPLAIDLRNPLEKQIDERREFISSEEKAQESINDEIEEWNEAYYE